MAEKTAWVGEKKKEASIGLIPKKVIKTKKDTPSTKNFKVQLPFLFSGNAQSQTAVKNRACAGRDPLALKNPKIYLR
jgi:hypothetical protein